MVELVIGIVLFIIVAGLVMIGTNILYYLAETVIPIIAVIMIVFGITMGFVVAIKNTFTVYKRVFIKRGK